MTSSEAFTLAKQKARYSQYDWVIWRNKDGSFSAERSSYGSIKKALLSVGTQGHFNMIQSRTAWSHLMTWRLGVNALNYMKRYEINAHDFEMARALVRSYKNRSHS